MAIYGFTLIARGTVQDLTTSFWVDDFLSSILDVDQTSDQQFDDDKNTNKKKHEIHIY